MATAPVGNATLRHANVSLLGIAEAIAPVEVASSHFDEQLRGVLKELGLPRRLLERVAGVETRRNWENPKDYIAGAAEAGRKAMAQAGVTGEQIGLLINSSVSREELGNVGPASLPITLAREAREMQRGDRILCMGVGSGLNTAMLEITW
ncbi:3-oxoacyl-[acyl-carrier-protein] synthase III C-terminal domain-containing protein [Gulosibacter molinativorax]|uniref:3-oxoacyl-[acyl-carrier-protein] synthase III C-terminal domain-containing protein n=1 Tax=Gulosibacter molinativorax TaxID=256821 RepID=UPI00040CDA78|nr:3-oxoacyl-[acyl-carrier-protein] synthase III C-terminal domain-containing protein [Gulosibacter molinativorax]